MEAVDVMSLYMPEDNNEINLLIDDNDKLNQESLLCKYEKINEIEEKEKDRIRAEKDIETKEVNIASKMT